MKSNNIDRFIKDLKQISDFSFKLSNENIDWKDNDEADEFVDASLRKTSEQTYQQIALDIVQASSKQLNYQNNSKNRLKQTFMVFFIIFISVQYLVLASFLYIKAFVASVHLTDTVIISYITSVFVETIGAIIIMIKYAFDSKQEVNILEILNGVIKNYQKFK